MPLAQRSFFNLLPERAKRLASGHRKIAGSRPAGERARKFVESAATGQYAQQHCRKQTGHPVAEWRFHSCRPGPNQKLLATSSLLVCAIVSRGSVYPGAQFQKDFGDGDFDRTRLAASTAQRGSKRQIRRVLRT